MPRRLDDLICQFKEGADEGAFSDRDGGAQKMRPRPPASDPSAGSGIDFFPTRREQLMAQMTVKTQMTCAVLLAVSLGLAPAAVDRNGNGMSDVWEMIYGADALLPNGDADEDVSFRRQAVISSLPNWRSGWA